MLKTHSRADQLKQVARHLKLEYHPTDQWGIRQQLQDFRLFRRGLRGRFYHVMSYEDGLLESRVHIFDYHYLRFAGKHSKRVTQTVFFLESRKLVLSEFYMRPEYFFHRVGEMLGITEDIDFEQHLDFSNNYRLTGEDEDFVRHNFKDEILQFFAIEKGWTMEGVGFYLVLYKHGKLLSPPKINEFYHQGMEVYRGLKS
jgi:hypothetical protein